ncbi:MAG TPA: hypothetical protein VMT19_13255 [Thermoanaerobaculaceae bacterium]|nr:hypothetical protein [Thermoanaerobaculaceae bacterium]
MRRRTRFVVTALVVVPAVAFLGLMLHYVPFYAPSFAVWIGIAAALAGAASLVYPLRFLGVRTRVRGLALAFCGVGLAVAALFLPASVTRSARPDQRLDRFLPEYQFSEYHQVRVRAPREAVARATREVSLADMPAAVWLLRIRAAASGRFRTSTPDPRPLLDLMSQPGSGFLPLDTADPGELVYGMVGFVHKPRPPVTTPEQFAAFTEPGALRVAFNLRVVPEGDGTVRVSSETRCLANRDEARRAFARYWRIIYPGSAIIRRVWLDAIVARAQRHAEPS